jgi:hypothetical protein
MVDKLDRGEAVVVAALGGSVTRGHGGGPNAGDRKLGHPGSWSRLVYDYIKARWPHTDHAYANGAVPATGARRAARQNERVRVRGVRKAETIATASAPLRARRPVPPQAPPTSRSACGATCTRTRTWFCWSSRSTTGTATRAASAA